MTFSIKTKFAILTAVSLLLLASGVALFSSSSVEKNMTVMQEQAAVNALNLCSMNVNDQYRSLVRWRIGEVLAVKQFLADFAATVSVLEEQARLGGGKLASPSRILEKLHLPKNVGVLAFNNDLKVAFSRGDVPLKARLASAQDIKGRPVAATMQREARAGRPATSVVEQANDAKYYGVHTWLPSWKWTVGLWINLNALKQREVEVTRSMVLALNESVGQVRIGESGYLFCFDGTGRAIIPPPGVKQGEIIDLHAAESGEEVLHLLRQGATTPDVPVRLEMFEKGDTRTWQARVRYVKPLDWYIVSVAYLDEVKTPGRKLSANLGMGIGGAAIVILFASLILSGRMTAPLMQLAEYARKVPEQDFLKETDGDSNLLELAQKRTDEVGRLAQSFVFMDKALRERVQELLSATAARERIESELSVAHEIQMGMLPKALTHEEERPSFTIRAFLEPAKEIGGDLYDYFMLDEDHLCFTVGDVSGKGVPASLFMSLTLALLRAGARLGQSSERLMASINTDLSRDNPRCMFVTLLLGVLNIRTGEIAYSNGGHNYPLILNGKDECGFLEGISGPLVGATGDLPYTGLTATLKPGDAIFVYSDGVTEAMDAENKLFSDPALCDTLAKGKTTDPDTVIALVREAVADHVKGHPASDDITMLCLRYEGPTAIS